MDKEITRGLALDSAVAVATANYTKQLIDTLDEASADKGYKAVWAMSPGTGDWPVGQTANIAKASTPNRWASRSCRAACSCLVKP